MPATRSVTQLEMMLTSARRHGEESEPDTEVGDLQALVRMLWAAASEKTRVAVAKQFSDECGDWLDAPVHA